jgi:DNA-binding LacI/PurR family transcriptional regulator
MKQIPVTSFDVAAHAGVSQSTVSRALSGSRTISAETRARIAEAAAELGYVVNRTATNLRVGASRTLALVVICRAEEDALKVSSFHYALLGAIASAAAQRQYRLIVQLIDGYGAPMTSFARSREADAVIVIGTNDNATAWGQVRALIDAGEPVLCWGAPQGFGRWIRSDNQGGIAAMVDHLVERGCRSISFVGPAHTAQRQFEERFDGYQAAMTRHGLPVTRIRHDEQHARFDQGVGVAQAAVAAGGLADAYLCACDQIALGVMHGFRELGVAIPAGTRVAGFDGIPEGEFCDPTLSTISPDFAVAGQQLVDAGLAMIRGEAANFERVPTRLIIRGSTG